MNMLKVLYEDQELLVAVKPAGMESQAARRFEPDMVSAIRNHLVMNKSCTPGQAPYVGVIHRLDKPVSGVMVYAKTKNAAAALSSQLQKHQMKKVYEAVVCGKPVNSVENLVDYLKKSVDGNDSQVVDKGITGAKRAELTLEALRFLEEGPNAALLRFCGSSWKPGGIIRSAFSWRPMECRFMGTRDTDGEKRGRWRFAPFLCPFSIPGRKKGWNFIWSLRTAPLRG